jgi:hypothetical protein
VSFVVIYALLEFVLVGFADFYAIIGFDKRALPEGYFAGLMNQDNRRRSSAIIRTDDK